MKRRIWFAGAVAAVTLAAGAALAQEAEPSPTPVPTPSVEAPAEPAPEPPAAPEAAPTPALTAAPSTAAPPPAAPPTTAPPPAAPPAAPVPAVVAAPAAPAAPPARVTDAPMLAVLQAPPDNPFGLAAEVPAATPPKPAFVDGVVNGASYVAARIDPTGRVMGVREQRDPIPSLRGEVQRSLSRWVFDPARKGPENVETWAAMRLDIEVQIDAPRSVQTTLTPVTPSSPIPRPYPWLPDNAWLETRKGNPPEGGVPLESVDSPPLPKKTPWDADSYKGPFSARLWVKVNSTGIVEKVIPLEISDPILLPYLRRAISTWAFRPARAGGGAVDSWNELNLSGQVAYKVELKQIASLRRSLFGS
jgi:hypothetical protein